MRGGKSLQDSKEIVGCSLVVWSIWLSLINRPGWFDEFAVLANSRSNSGIISGKSLDWLQSMPVGYYYLTNLADNFPKGYLILRLISAISIFIAALLFVGIGKNLPKYLQSALLIFLCLNPIVCTYALAAKPYALEILIGAIAFSLVVRRRYTYFFAVIILGVPFTSSLVTFEIAMICVVIIQKPLRLHLILSCVFLACLFPLSKFTSVATQEVMRNSWFGNIETSLLKRIIAGVGNFLWFPVSGLGILPENGSSKPYFILSGLIISLILVAIFLAGNKSPGRYIMFGNTVIAVALQGFGILPAAGRLLIPLAFVIWLEIMLFLRKINTSITYCICILLSASFIHQNLSSMPKATFSGELSVISEISNRNSSFYSTQDYAPLVQYATQPKSNKLSPNLLIVSRDGGELNACQDMKFVNWDVLIVPTELSTDISSNLRLLAHENFYMYKVEREFTINQPPRNQVPLNCDYVFGNPSKPGQN